MSTKKVLYGFCPICGVAGTERERRLNGDDRCANGHKYPSAKAEYPVVNVAQA